MADLGLFQAYLIHRILEISSLSDTDYILIVAHYHNIISGEKSEIDPALASRGYSEEALLAARKHSQNTFKPVIIQNLKFTRHLDNFKYGLMSYILTLFQHFERGVLPYPGSLSEQPAQVIEIFNLLSALKLEQENKAREKTNVRNTSQVYSRGRRQGRK